MLKPQHLPSGRLAILLLLLPLASSLSAQARAPRRFSPHPHFRQQAAVSEQVIEAPRTIAFLRTAPLPTLVELRFSHKTSLPSISQPAVRESVNLGLLLPSSRTLPSWASTSWVSTRSTSAREPANVFAPDPPPPSTDLPARFNDVQFYTRHIPGVAPIVDRFFQESKAHPQIVRVLQYLHPKF